MHDYLYKMYYRHSCVDATKTCDYFLTCATIKSNFKGQYIYRHLKLILNILKCDFIVYVELTKTNQLDRVSQIINPSDLIIIRAM